MIENKEGTLTALIAEHDEKDFALFSDAINRISVRVVLTRARDGEILIKLLEEKETNPHVLFLDPMLPVINGRDCLKLIRRNPKFDYMPVVIYSEPKKHDTVEFCYRESANLFVFKPRTSDELVLMLERIFSLEWNKVMYYPPIDQFVLNPQYTIL